MFYGTGEKTYMFMGLLDEFTVQLVLFFSLICKIIRTSSGKVCSEPQIIASITIFYILSPIFIDEQNVLSSFQCTTFFGFDLSLCFDGLCCFEMVM